jgi:tetratricopeptide (TPR) repeat protein
MFSAEVPIEVFCCYALEDETWLRKLETHLSLLKRRGLIATWHDRLVRPGANRAEEIDAHLNSASVILLLISADFLTSDYCSGGQMQRALRRQEAGEARVLPILVRSVDLIPAPFTHLQVLPTDARALSTWSDQDTALADVVAGIRRVIEDLYLLAASAPRATQSGIWNVPYPRNSFFMGRDDLLKRLHTQLQAGRTTALSQPQAISGLGGIGKTQIAVEYAYRYRREYDVVLWASAETQESLTSSYNSIATLLKLPEREAAEQELVIQAVKRWLQCNGKWLLILDNADDLDLVPPLLPLEMGGHLLLTTRAWDMQRLAQRLEVDALSDEQGAVFLLRRAGLLAADAELSQVIAAEKTLALQLAREMGGLPLALDQAGAYLEATGMSLSEYQQVYRQYRQVLLQERRARVPDHPEPVATTWALSFARVEEKSPAGADLLRLCAFLSPDAIAEEILTEGASVLGPILEPVVGDPLLLSKAIEALRAYSLVGRDPRVRTLSVHRLVQAVLQDGMDEERRKVWAERAVRAVNKAFPHVEHRIWPQCERLLPHALCCAELIEEYQLTFSEAARLLSQLGYYLQERARYQEAEPLYRQALAIREMQLGPDHPDTASSLNNLATLYDDQGKYTEAEPLDRRALAICEKQLGPDHPYTASSLNNLAYLYNAQGKYTEAEPLYRRALAICEKQLGPDHPYTASSLNNLAMLYNAQGKYAEAEPLLRRALAIKEQKLGVAHPSTQFTRENYASLLRKMERDQEADAIEATRPPVS